MTFQNKPGLGTPASQRHRHWDGDWLDFGLSGIIRPCIACLADRGTRVDFEDHFAGLQADGANETPQ